MPNSTLFVTFVPVEGVFLCHPLGLIIKHSQRFEAKHLFISIDERNWCASYMISFKILRDKYGIRQVISGDLFLNDADCSDYWLDRILRGLGMQLVMPLRHFRYSEQILDLLGRLEIRATVSGVTSQYYKPEFLGKPISLKLLDACGHYGNMKFDVGGEHGEYHTTVIAHAGESYTTINVETLDHVVTNDIWHLRWPLHICEPSVNRIEFRK